MANPNPSYKIPKGTTPNPNGRPKKGYSITEMMREMMESEPELKKAIGKVIAKKALEGDMAAIDKLWKYMDGMPPQSIDVTSQGDKVGTINELFAKYGKDNNKDVSETS